MNCPCEDNCPAGCPCDDFDCDSGDLPGPEVPEPGDDKMVLVISSHPANKPMFKVDFHGKYTPGLHGPDTVNIIHRIFEETRTMMSK